MTVDVSPITVLQLSDLHLFADSNQELLGLNTNQALDQVLEQVIEQQIHPNLILLTGDLAQDESEEAYVAIQAKFSDYSSPIYTIPGNHDDPDLMRKVFVQEPFQPDRNFVARGWRFILLDSSMPGQVQGRFSTQVLDRLKHDLEASKEPVILVMHHPAYLVNSQWLDQIGLENREQFWTVIDPFENVKLVLCGHVHQDTPFTRNGVQYLSAPSTCVQFEPQSEKFVVGDQNPGYRLLNLYSDGTSETTVERVVLSQTVNFQADGY